MITVGAFEAKSRFSALLEKVAAGEEITITKHGKPVARIVGARTARASLAQDAFEKLKALRAGTTLGGLSWKDLRDAGRP